MAAPLRCTQHRNVLLPNRNFNYSRTALPIVQPAISIWPPPRRRGRTRVLPATPSINALVIALGLVLAIGVNCFDVEKSLTSPGSNSLKTRSPLLASPHTDTVSGLSGNELYRPAPPDMPIPNRLNLVLVALVFASSLGLLWLGSYVDGWLLVLGLGIVFSFVAVTNYALLHEATHGNLHSCPRCNYVLGVLTGLLFPIPFDMIRTTHQGHHLRNRTDFEMFDLYYAHDNRFVKWVQWYGILCGFFWPWIPLGALLFACCPSVLRARVFRQARSSRHLLGDIQAGEIRAIRWQVLLIIASAGAAFWLLDLRWQSVLMFYGCFSVNWSTRQYVGHAFTKRDVLDGAWNLRASWWMSLILLRGEYDLNHHRHPEVSWYYLPRLSRPDEPRLGYWRQYWRQWRGPRPATEPAPETLQSLPLTLHG
jgi:fatty acid desaturase